MGIGAGIFLAALGAILTFAVDYSISGLDIAVVGVILMIAGVAGIALELAVFGPRRRRVSRRPSHLSDGYVETGPPTPYPDYADPQAPVARVRRETTTEYPANRRVR